MELERRIWPDCRACVAQDGVDTMGFCAAFATSISLAARYPCSLSGNGAASWAKRVSPPPAALCAASLHVIDQGLHLALKRLKELNINSILSPLAITFELDNCSFSSAVG